MTHAMPLAQRRAERMADLRRADLQLYNRFYRLASQTPFDRQRIDALLLQAEWEAGLLDEAGLWQEIVIRLACCETDPELAHGLSVRRGDIRLSLAGRDDTARLEVWHNARLTTWLTVAVWDGAEWQLVAGLEDLQTLARRFGVGYDPVAWAVSFHNGHYYRSEAYQARMGVLAR